VIIRGWGRSQRDAAVPRVGLFGILGTGNIGNDAQMNAVLRYLRTDHPDVILDAMCTGRPETLLNEYGISAVHLRWRHERAQDWQGRARQGTASPSVVKRAWPSLAATTAQSLRIGWGMIVTALRMASWVRRHDVVIVPGSGMFETTMPLRPWETPYAMFLLCGSGRLFRTKIALVSVGANVMTQGVTRWLMTSAARLAFYRSYRDTMSRDAMHQQGIDTARDYVYPDLVFGIPAPPYDPGDAQTVGVGVAAYYGTNNEREQAAKLHSSYVAAMTRFLEWLIDTGRNVRLFVGDTNGGDENVVREILSGLQERRPDLDPAQVVAEPATSFEALMRTMAPVGTVVATRYHNVMCALKLAKPTISIGYSEKHDALMAAMGQSQYCQSARSLDVDRLIEQFKELEDSSAELQQTMTKRHTANARLLDQQFARLSAILFAPQGPDRTSAPYQPSSAGTR
jgi:polysaccharide pyruvyl transferase WcaK-like protein